MILCSWWISTLVNKLSLKYPDKTIACLQKIFCCFCNDTLTWQPYFKKIMEKDSKALLGTHFLRCNCLVVTWASKCLMFINALEDRMQQRLYTYHLRVYENMRVIKVRHLWDHQMHTWPLAENDLPWQNFLITLLEIQSSEKNVVMY